MNNNIYQIFYSKMPSSMAEVMPKYDRCMLVTCLNPYYLIKLDESDYPLYKSFDYIASDGIGPIKMNKWFGHPKSLRISFDMSGQNGNDGLAGKVFEECSRLGIGLFILGSHEDAVKNFVSILSTNYPRMIISGFHNGYIKDCWDVVLEEIISSGAKVVIVGMGAPLQERVALDLKKKGFIGTVYTCGGFIHQTTSRMEYYPKWVDKYNLRAFYRIIHEKGMIPRLFETYPLFLWRYSKFLLSLSKRR